MLFGGKPIHKHTKGFLIKKEHCLLVLIWLDMLPIRNGSQTVFAHNQIKKGFLKGGQKWILKKNPFLPTL